MKITFEIKISDGVTDAKYYYDALTDFLVSLGLCWKWISHSVGDDDEIKKT